MNLLLFKLLRKSFISVFLITTIVFFTISLISMAIYKYDNYLKNSFAKKQPHIIIRYISDNTLVNINQEIIKIKNILGDDLDTCNSFTKTEQNVKIQKGLGVFRGKIAIIGLGLERYPITYDFNKFDIRLIEDYDIRLTGIELFYLFKKKNVIFNKTLQKAFLNFAPSVSTNYVMFLKHNKPVKITFMGVLDDLKEKPILFMSRNYFNKTFGYDKNHINGFYINIKNQNKLNNDIKKLSKVFIKARVFSWRNVNKKQDNILNVFSTIAKIIQIILIILALIAILVVFFNGIITKSNQIRILKIIGVNLSWKINIIFFIITILGEFLGVFLVNLFDTFYFSESLILFMIFTPLLSLLFGLLFFDRKINAKI